MHLEFSIIDKLEGKVKQLQEQLPPFSWEPVPEGYVGVAREMVDAYQNEQGAWYEGEQIHGIENGRGARIHPTGGLDMGYWQKGCLQGRIRQIFPSGNYFEGDIEGGKKNGYGKFVSFAGRTYEGTFNNDQMDG